MGAILSESQERIELRSYGWCAIELFGHTVIAGRAEEVRFGNGIGIRVVSPVGNDGEEWVATYNPSSVFAVHQCEEVVARRVAIGQPIHLWKNYVDYPRQQEARLRIAELAAEARETVDYMDEVMREFPPDDIPF